MDSSRAHQDPPWWNERHSSAWERIKEALHRDWEQTKAHVSDSGKELNQDVAHTVKQSVGKERIPPADQPNPGWVEVEPAVRYGHGARGHFSGQEWNEDLERQLEKDWHGTGENSWDRVKAAVRHGWDSLKR